MSPYLHVEFDSSSIEQHLYNGTFNGIEQRQWTTQSTSPPWRLPLQCPSNEMSLSQSSTAYRSTGVSIFLTLTTSYRTLSIHVDDKPSVTNKTADQATLLGRSMFMTLDNDQVFHRYSTHPNWGLNTPPWNANQRWQEYYIASCHQYASRYLYVEPDISIFLNCRYWKKILNYIFGGFQFFDVDRVYRYNSMCLVSTSLTATLYVLHVAVL